MQKIKKTREEIAVEEMTRTTAQPGCRLSLLILFVLILVGVPLAQFVDDIILYTQGMRADVLPEMVRLSPLGTAAARGFQAATGPLPARISDANRALLQEMGRHETRIEDASWLARIVLPAAQGVFTRSLKLGNEKVYCGRKRILFYRPDIDFVAGRAFLDPVQMHTRQLASTDRRIPVEPNPIPAILQFDRELKQLGIQLILLPIPAKPTIQETLLYEDYPEHFGLPENPSYNPFLEILRTEGIQVFDCREILKKLGRESYLKQDTHWKPLGVDHVAKALAEHISQTVPLQELPPAGYTRRTVGVATHGDIADLLPLPVGFKHYGLERVEIQQVVGPDRQLWSRTPGAEILLLGDSFSNIYSMPSLNWGRSAGFAEQLSFYLQRPLDRIAFNDNGSYTTRRELVRRHGAGDNPLAGKKVVIWEFAARELAQGDWQKHSLLSDVPE